MGTLAMTAMMYVVASMMGLRIDIAAMLGSMLGGSWTAGLMMHFVNGAVIFPAIYVYALYAHLPGSPAVRGTVWGVALWLVAQTVVMPMMGAGLFSSAMGGMMAAMGSLTGHVLYGSLFGIVASAPERGSRTREPQPSGRLCSSLRATARFAWPPSEVTGGRTSDEDGASWNG